MSTALAQLEQAVRSRSPLEAVVAACRAWALVPSTRLARIARGLAAQAPGDAVAGANQEEREAAWQAMAARAGPVELQDLLATPWSKKPKDAAARLAQLKRLGPDPRIVGALLDLDTGGRYPSAAGHRFWQDAYELLLSWGSVEAATRVPRDLSASDYASPWTTARYGAIFEPLTVRWAGRWPVEPSLEAWANDALLALEARLEPRRELVGGLLAAVHAAPHEDSPKLVLSDALTEQGDLRGEFIALQFAHAAGELTMGKRERMQRLLSASGSSWFDGLEGQVAPLAVFHKGFLREVRLETRTPNASLAGWATVETIDTAGIAGAWSGFLNHLEGVQSLRSLRGATLEELARLGSARDWGLLEVEHFGGRDFAAPAWTVERLRLKGNIDQASWWLLGTPLLPRTRALEFSLTQSFDRVGPTLRELESRAPGVARLSFSSMPPPWPTPWHGAWKLDLERDAKGRFSRGTLSLGDEVLTGLDLALASLAPKQLKALAVTSVLRRGPVWRASTQAMIAQHVAGTFDLEKPTALAPRPVIHEGR